MKDVKDIVRINYCKDCKWFYKWDKEPERIWGCCSYNPPAFTLEKNVYNCYPRITEDNEGCSKFERIQPIRLDEAGCRTEW